MDKFQEPNLSEPSKGKRKSKRKNPSKVKKSDTSAEEEDIAQLFW